MRFRKWLQPRPLLIVAIALFCLYFGTVAWFRQAHVATSQFDMGNMDQTVWHTLHGQFFQMTDPGAPVLRSRAAWHADFLLVIYTPFYALWQDPRTLMILQVVFVASGAIPLFWLARKRLGSWLALAMSFFYLVYPPQMYGMLFDVHAVVLVAPLILWAWWAATEKRWWIYYPAIVLALLGKEEVGVTIAALGFYWVWRKGYRWMGAVTMVLGLATTITMLWYVIPHLRGAAGHFALGSYSAFGSSTSEVVRNMLTRPGQVFQTLVTRENLSLTARLLAPVAALPVLGLPVLLIATPEFFVNFLSNYPNQHTILFQYMSVIVPFIFLATIEGLVWLQRRTWVHFSRVSVAFTVIGLGAMWVMSPIPGFRHGIASGYVFTPSPYQTEVSFVRKDLRPEDKVVATNNIIPQFSQRNLIWGYPNAVDQADAVVVLEGDIFEFDTADKISNDIRALQDNPNFTLVLHRDKFWYYRRVAQ